MKKVLYVLAGGLAAVQANEGLRGQRELQVPIDDGTEFFIGGTTEANLTVAQAECVVGGGILAEVYSEDEFQALKTFIAGSSIAEDDVWIGLKDDTGAGGGTASHFTYFNGPRVAEAFYFWSTDGKEPWGGGQPVALPNVENCVIMVDGMWETAACTSFARSVCRRNPSHLQLYTDATTQVYMTPETYTFHDAVKKCFLDGGEHILVGDKTLNNALKGLVGTQDNNAWVGLTDAYDVGGTTRSRFDAFPGSKDRRTLSFFDTARGSYPWSDDGPQPNDLGGDQNCVSLSPLDYGWFDDPCTLLRSAICKRSVPPPIKHYAVVNQTTQFFVIDTLTNFDNAQAICQSYGANLVRMSTDDELTFVTDFLMEVDLPERVWNGLKDANDSGESGFARFSWVDQSNSPEEREIYLTTGSPWYPGQPNDPAEDCVALRSASENFAWHDYPCDRNFYPLCRKEL